MKNLGLSLILACIVSLAWAQGSEQRKLSDFDKVSTQEGIEVYLKKGNAPSATVESDNVPLDEILTEVSGGTLKISLDGNNYKNVDVDVYVTYTTLSALKASSGGSISVETPVNASGDFEISCSSAGKIELELSASEVEVDVSSAGYVEMEVNAKSVEFDASSAGKIEASGTANDMEGEASSSGKIDADELKCKNASVRSSSGGSIRIYVSENLDARASSGGSVKYVGSPKNKDVDTSSGGSVKAD